MAAGFPVRFRTREWTVPSLTLDEVESFTADGTLSKVPANGNGFEARVSLVVVPESRPALRSVLRAALAHNYGPDEVAQAMAEVDLENAGRIVDALMAATRLDRKERGEGEPAPQTPSSS
jgi:hypothetical protein